MFFWLKKEGRCVRARWRSGPRPLGTLPCALFTALFLLQGSPPEASATLIYQYVYTGNAFDPNYVTPPYTTANFISAELLTQFPIEATFFEQRDRFLKISISDGLQTFVYDYFQENPGVTASVLMEAVDASGLPEAWDVNLSGTPQDNLGSTIITVSRPAIGGGRTEIDRVATGSFPETLHAAVYGNPGSWQLTTYEDPNVPFLIPEVPSLALFSLGIACLGLVWWKWGSMG